MSQNAPLPLLDIFKSGTVFFFYMLLVLCIGAV